MIKKFYPTIGLLLLFLLLLTGCNQSQTNGDSAQGSPSGVEKLVQVPDANSSQDQESPAFVTKDVTLISTDNSSLLAIGSSDADLFFLPTSDVQILNLKNKEISSSELVPGMILTITYNGEIMESYPASFGEVSTMKVKQIGSNLVELYYQMILDIFSQDTALNDDTSIIALDLTQASNLTDGEKSALSYLVMNGFMKDCYLYTYEELISEGLIDDEALYFRDGILITIAVTKETSDSFTFSISKWRSGLGAIGYNDCTAKRNGTEWTYKLTNGLMWIS